MQEPSLSEYDETHPKPYSPLPDGLKIDIVLNGEGRILLFHNTALRKFLSWLEFDKATGGLTFILKNGQSHNFGIPIGEPYASKLKECRQILMIHVVEETGQPLSGFYLPLILR